jgi:hypothetical protein
MPTTKLSEDILLAAIEGFESQKRRIEDQIAELRQMLDGHSAQSAAAPKTTRGRRKISAEGRARIAEAQRNRWAAKKAADPAATPEAVTPRPKRKLSAAGRKAIVEATRKRWARVKGEAVAKAAKKTPAKTRRKTAQKTTAKGTQEAVTSE